MKKTLDELALFYWQDRLAKFAPTIKEPNGFEKSMFKGGYSQGYQAAIEELRSIKAMEIDLMEADRRYVHNTLAMFLKERGKENGVLK